MKKLDVYTRDEAHQQVLKELEYVIKKIKEEKAVAFGFCMVFPDNTISTAYFNCGGNLHTLHGAAYTLAGRITNDTI